MCLPSFPFKSYEHFKIIIFFRKHNCDSGRTLLTQDPGHLHNVQANPPFPTFSTNYTFKLVSSNTYMHICIMGDGPISISYYCKTYLKWECIGRQQKKKKLIQKPLWRYPHIPISPPLCQILVKVSKCPDFVIDSHPHSTFMSAWRWSYFKHVKTFFVSINMKFSEYTFISSYTTMWPNLK